MYQFMSTPTGYILTNKPEDWTSHDVVGYLRRVTGIKKIGHAGTLDPFATGLLIVGIGREATKHLDTFKDLYKQYKATMVLGATSSTYDKTGALHTIPNIHLPSKQVLQDVLERYKGPQEQIPPMYSAKKIKGKKLYELARKGIEVQRAPHHITITELELISYNDNKITLSCTVSPGTYIRSLVHDIGQTMQTGAYCETLERTAIGPYTVSEAIFPKEITTENWQRYLKTPHISEKTRLV